MSLTNSILAYAERLSNIRQISISCSLHNPATSETKASITSDGQTLTIDHGGVRTSVQLPGSVLPSQQINPVWPVGTKDISWRLPLAPASSTSQEEQNVPWSAGDLQPEIPITCRQCQATVVDAGLIKVWKDLPSENWAEMMEFWHCHKPDHAHTHAHDENLASRAYGANSRISAQSGVGFVDLTSFLLSETDISASKTNLFFHFGTQLSNPSSAVGSLLRTGRSLSLSSRVSLDVETLGLSRGTFVFPYDKFITQSLSSIGLAQITGDRVETPKTEQSNALQPENSPIFCVSCKSQLGVLNDQTSVSLFKWRVHLSEKAQPATRIVPSLEHCFSAMLLATMARSGCSKSIVLPMKVQGQSNRNGLQTTETSSQFLNIWVFNSNIAFSSIQLAKPVLAVKVFYRMVSQTEADKLLDSMTSDVQDISLPADAISEVLDTLNRSNGFLPPSNRLFKEWKVGLLEKWDEDQ